MTSGLLPPTPARLHVLLAREAPIAVIIRRGPSAWVQLIHWDTKRDIFTPGQWFKGRVYENKCDLSPDGKLLIYFALKGSNGQKRPDYGFTWTAISKPPYFTALALWKEHGTWGGGGHFIDDKTVRIYVPKDSFHPDHAPRGITVLDSDSRVTLNMERRDQVRFARWEMVSNGRDVRDDYKALLSTLNAGTSDSQLDVDGDWYQLLDAEMEGKSGNSWMVKLNPPTIWRKPYADYSIEKHYFGYRMNRGEINRLFVVNNKTSEKVLLSDATWADFDQQGRLVLAKEGKLFAGTLENGDLKLTELADFNANKPEQVIAPDWAQKW
jgi:hypothetical protein